MKKKIEFDTVKNGIKFKIKRPKKDTFVMAIPLDDINKLGLHIVYNGNEPYQNHYDWGKEEKIYLCHCDSTPSLYFKSGQNHLKLTITNEDSLDFLPITATPEINTYYKDGEYCVSSASNCWGIFIYDSNEIDGEKIKDQLLTREKYDKKEH